MSAPHLTLPREESSLLLVEKILAHLQSAWSISTSSTAGWSNRNPSQGQSFFSALVVQDMLGGDMEIGFVNHAMPHVRNRTHHGVVDLTRDQFKEGIFNESEYMVKDETTLRLLYGPSYTFDLLRKQAREFLQYKLDDDLTSTKPTSATFLTLDISSAL